MRDRKYHTRPRPATVPPAGFSHWGGSVDELGVPVGDVQEVFPGLVAGVAEGDLDERMPAWLGGSLDELHTGLEGEQSPFPRVAAHAAADDILPDGLPPARQGDHMVQVQLAGGKPAAAVLAPVLVAEEDVLAREADFMPRQP